jgi:hypothetical protein
MEQMGTSMVIHQIISANEGWKAITHDSFLWSQKRESYLFLSLLLSFFTRITRFFVILGDNLLCIQTLIGFWRITENYKNYIITTITRITGEGGSDKNRRVKDGREGNTLRQWKPLISRKGTY